MDTSTYDYGGVGMVARARLSVAGNLFRNFDFSDLQKTGGFLFGFYFLSNFFLYFLYNFCLGITMYGVCTGYVRGTYGVPTAICGFWDEKIKISKYLPSDAK